MRGFEEFVLGYLVNSLWQVPLICMAGYACARLVRRIGPQAEQRVWVTALLGGAILPACGIAAAWMPHGFGTGAPAVGSVQVEVGKFTETAGTALHLPPELRHGAVIAYLGIVLFLCGRLVWGLIQSEGLRRASRKLTLSRDWQTVWERYCRSFDVRDVEIASMPGISGPLTLGFQRRTLLVPSEFMETAEANDVEAALGHELAHIRRRDFAKNVVYELISLPVSYHPMTRWLKSQVRQSRELVCDAMAAEFVTTREHYARSLLRLSSQMLNQTRAVNIHAIGIFDANILERRVMSLMTKQRETRWLLRAGFAVVCVVVGLATCASALALRLDVNEPPPPPATATQASGSSNFTGVKIIYRKPPVYPAKAKAEKDTINGPCVLEMTVDVDGVPTNLHVVKSLRSDYDQSAMDAVREWRFTPAMKDGKPVAVDTHVEINYSIE